MKKLATLMMMMVSVAALAQSNCDDYTAPTSKQIKVTLYTQTDQCFTLSNESGIINQSPSKRVVFTMDLGTTKAKIKLANGTEIVKSIPVTNPAMSSVVYEIVYNEKKGEYDVKNRLGQADVTAEQHQKNDEQFAQMQAENKEKAAARDKEWEEASAKRKAEQEAEAEAERQAEADKKADAEKQRLAEAEKQKANAASSPANTNGSTPSSPTGTTTTVNGSAKVDAPKGYPYGFVFSYQGKPIANTKFTFRNQNGAQEVIMSGTTDNTGLVVMYTEAAMGKYDVKLTFEVAGKESKAMFPTITLGNTSQDAYVIDYNSAVEGRMNFAKCSRTEAEKAYSLDWIFK